MKKLLLIIIHVLFIQTMIAQVKFERVYGGKDYDYGYSVTQTFDKGYLVAGVTSSFGNGSTDGCLLKTDSMGIAKWYKMFGGTNIDRFYSIMPTRDSAFIVAGYSNSFGNGYEGYVIKIDSLGNTIWSKTYGGSDWDFIFSIDTTSDGGYILCGGTYSYGNGDQDMYVVKTDTNGDTLWTKTYGGNKEDVAKSITQTLDGGYILTGVTKSFGDIDGDIYTIKTNSLGDTLWTRREINTGKDIGNDIVQNKINSEYFIAGNMTKNGDQRGVYINYDQNGFLIWPAEYNTGPLEEAMNSVAISNIGRIALYGYTKSIGGGDSDVLWYQKDKPYQGTMGGANADVAYCVNKTADNGFIICGTAKSFPPSNSFEHIYLIKVDSNGVASGAGTTVVTDLVNIVGIKEKPAQEAYFQIYPNPGTDYININYDKALLSPVVISITDINGKEYYTQNSNNIISNNTIPVFSLSNGMYFITIQNNEFKSTQKLIIQR